MKNKNTIILFAVILFFSCENKNDFINGTIVDKHTKKPIPGVNLSFGVSKGSGFYNTYEKNKYFATTDKNGKFEFKASSDDISHTFYISDNYDGFYSDSLSSAATHILEYSSNNTYILQGDIKPIYFKPSGIVRFYIIKETYDKMNFDTLTIKSKYEEDTIYLDKNIGLLQSIEFTVEPYQTQNFQINKIKNGVKTIYDLMKLYVTNYRNKGGGVISKEITTIN